MICVRYLFWHWFLTMFGKCWLPVDTSTLSALFWYFVAIDCLMILLDVVFLDVYQFLTQNGSGGFLVWRPFWRFVRDLVAAFLPTSMFDEIWNLTFVDLWSAFLPILWSRSEIVSSCLDLFSEPRLWDGFDFFMILCINCGSIVCHSSWGELWASM